MLACEWYRMRKACGTLLSGYGTELTLVHDALQQREGISQAVHFRSPTFFSYGQFIPDSVNPQRDPNAPYSFDSERDATQSEICRQNKNKECIIVGLKIITQPATC
jgi:hypothetical protein